MAKQMTFKQEHYTAVADFIAVSFERFVRFLKCI